MTPWLSLAISILLFVSEPNSHIEAKWHHKLVQLSFPHLPPTVMLHYAPPLIKLTVLIAHYLAAKLRSSGGELIIIVWENYFVGGNTEYTRMASTHAQLSYPFLHLEVLYH